MRIGSRSLFWLIAVGLVASACGGSSDEAALCNVPGDLAVVEGSAITCDDLTALRPGYADDTLIASGDQVRGDLSRLIQNEAIVQAAEDEFDLEFTEAEFEARIVNPPPRWAGLLGDPNLSEADRRINAVATVVSDAVVQDLIVDQYGSIEAYTADQPGAVVRVCARTIVVQTEPEAFDVLARIDAGESFEELEPEVSLAAEQFEGGLLTINGQCPISVGQLGDQFVIASTLAPIGEPTGPVLDAGGFFHVLVVDERVSPDATTDAAAFLEVLDTTAQSELFGAWASEVLQSFEVDVASAVGTWSPEAFEILPPGFVAQGG